MPTMLDIVETLREHAWTVEQWPNGLWLVGPENENGVINVLGMDLDFLEAFRKAKETMA